MRIATIKVQDATKYTYDLAVFNLKKQKMITDMEQTRLFFEEIFAITLLVRLWHPRESENPNLILVKV